jgi:hypothetical protein
MSEHEQDGQSPASPSEGTRMNPQSGFPVGDAPSQPYPYPQNPYPPAYAYPPAAPQWSPYARPEHPRTMTAFVLAMIAGPGALATCGLTLLLSPFAWWYAAKARKDMRAAPAYYEGEGRATAAYVIGIIGTVVVVLALAAFIALTIWAATAPDDFNDYFDNGTTV